MHSWFLEPWNRKFDNVFHICLMNGLQKYQKKIFSWWLFEIIHIIGFEMRMDSRINLKIFFGYDIDCLNIWPFMHQPWFPTRTASKLIFACFQLACEWHHRRRKYGRCSPNSYFGSVWELYVLDLKTKVFRRKENQLHFPMNNGLTVPK